MLVSRIVGYHNLCSPDVQNVQAKKALERHKKLDHPVPGQEAKHLVCTEDECSYTFENYEMKRHIRGQHEGLKP